jgi:hypothetical protein
VFADVAVIEVSVVELVIEVSVVELVVKVSVVELVVDDCVVVLVVVVEDWELVLVEVAVVED